MTNPTDPTGKAPVTDSSEDRVPAATRPARKKVLIVSYVFPPMAAVGIYRVIKFCKYLPDFNWDPVVLTVRKGSNWSL